MWTQSRTYALIFAIRFAAAALLCLLAIVTFFAMCAVVIFLLARSAHATDHGQWAGKPQAVRDWYKSAELMPAARDRLGWVSCCAHSDVVHTKFRVGVTGDDVWEWLDGTTWRIVPADIIHWGEHAPDGQATLFVFGSTPTCFYPPEDGQ